MKKLKDILNIENLMKLIDDRYILVVEHPKNKNLKILNYSNAVMYDGKWNNETKKCRGLIIKTENDHYNEAIVVERPWEKFFTLEQHQEGWALGDEETDIKDTNIDIDFNAPAEVTDKIDGSLGIIYNDGEDIAIATRGFFTSDQAIYYNNFLKNNEEYYKQAKKLKETYPNITFLFELIGLNNRIVIKYDKDDIVFLGAVDTITGQYYSTDRFKDIWTLSTAEKMNAHNITEALSLPARNNKEGVVVRILSKDKQMQIKIKQDDYLKLHKLIHSFSKSDTISLLRNSNLTYYDFIKIYNNKTSRCIRTLQDDIGIIGDNELIDYIYEQFFNLIDNNILDIAKIVYDSYKYVYNLPENDFIGDQKDLTKNFYLSLKNNSKEEKALMIKIFKARLNFKYILNDIAQNAIQMTINKIKEEA